MGNAILVRIECFNARTAAISNWQKLGFDDFVLDHGFNLSRTIECDTLLLFTN